MGFEGLKAVIDAELFIMQKATTVTGQETYIDVPGTRFTITNQYITDFEMILLADLRSAQFTFTINDPLLEFIETIRMHNVQKSEYLRVIFRFGWNKAVWDEPLKTGTTSSLPDITKGLLGTITEMIPDYDQNGVTVTLRGVGAQLETALVNVFKLYTPNFSNISTVSNLYADIANTFNIDIRANGKSISDAGAIDDTFILVDNKNRPDAFIRPKRQDETGLDYLANEVYKRYPPTIGGKPVFARFNPLITNKQGFGVFEFLPMDQEVTQRVYNVRGSESKIIRYTPVINPWLADKAEKPIETTNTNEDTGSTETLQNSNKDKNSDEIRSYNTDAINDNKKNVMTSEQHRLLQKVQSASLEIIGDIYLVPYMPIIVNVFHPISSHIVSSINYFVKQITHKISGGIFTSSLELVSTFQPKKSTLSREVGINYKEVIKEFKGLPLPELNKLLKTYEEQIPSLDYQLPKQSIPGLNIGSLISDLDIPQIQL